MRLARPLSLGVLVFGTGVFLAACGGDKQGSGPGAVPPDADVSETAPPDAGSDATADTATDAVADATDASVLPLGITALAPYEPVEPWDDLAALDPLIGDAEVVGLGESIHTSGGFYGTKVRVIRYLVEKHGFRVVAVETPWVEADAVGQFVDTSVGDSTSVLRNIFGVFADRHMRELVEWLAAWNQANPEDPVAYLGFDIQQPWDDSRLLRTFLETAAPSDVALVHEPLLQCNGTSYASSDDYYGSGGFDAPIDPADHAACLEGIGAARAWFDEEEANLVAATSPEAVTLARLHLRGIEAWQNTVWGIKKYDYPLSFESRDEGMADAFDTLTSLRYPGKRVALWAHNLHIAERHDEIVGSSYAKARSMGTFLRERRGDGYRAFGILAYDTSVNWPGMKMGALPLPTGSDSTEVMLHDVGQPFLLVDLKASEPFFSPETLYRMHAGSPEYPQRLSPARQFHGLFFLDVSPAMEPLFW